MAQNIKYSFERFEKKYFLTPEQMNSLVSGMAPFVRPDEYGQYTICNIYYDTDDFRLIRESIEKPAYKEKLRVRSYGVPESGGKVFIELKKKYDGVVYKRRITAAPEAVSPILDGTVVASSQIGREIEWFQHYYKTSPKVFIAYDRTAFAGIDDSELRITFDTNMRWRDSDLDLRFGDAGLPIIGGDRVLMEVKLPGTCPLWLAHLLSSVRAAPASFSKYGTCYCEHIIKDEHPIQVKNNIKEAHLCP